MITVDTNILVRLLMRDDEAQYRKVVDLFANEKIFILDTVLLETEWVLRFTYKVPPYRFSQIIGQLIGMKTVYVDNEERIKNALTWHQEGLDFADALHLVQAVHFEKFATFDQQFAKRAEAYPIPVNLL